MRNYKPQGMTQAEIQAYVRGLMYNRYPEKEFSLLRPEESPKRKVAPSPAAKTPPPKVTPPAAKVPAKVIDPDLPLGADQGDVEYDTPTPSVTPETPVESTTPTDVTPDKTSKNDPYLFGGFPNELPENVDTDFRRQALYQYLTEKYRNTLPVMNQYNPHKEAAQMQTANATKDALLDSASQIGTIYGRQADVDANYKHSASVNQANQLYAKAYDDEEEQRQGKKSEYLKTLDTYADADPQSPASQFYRQVAAEMFPTLKEKLGPAFDKMTKKDFETSLPLLAKMIGQKVGGGDDWKNKKEFEGFKHKNNMELEGKRFERAMALAKLRGEKGGKSPEIQAREERHDEVDAQKLAKSMAVLQGLSRTMSELEEGLGFSLDGYTVKDGKGYGGGILYDLPGSTVGGARVPPMSLGDKGTNDRRTFYKLEGLMSAVKNAQIHELAGAASTQSEVARIQKEFGMGTMTTEEDMLLAYQRLKRAVVEDMKNLRAGFPDSAVRKYEGGGGRTDYPTPKLPTPERRIRIRNSKGQTGSIPESKFDPKRHQRID